MVNSVDKKYKKKAPLQKKKASNYDITISLNFFLLNV